MPWENRSEKQMREEFVKRVLSKEKSKSALCREYGISRPTGDKRIHRYLAGQGLSERSTRPKRIAAKTLPEIEQRIVDCRMQHPAIGAMKIRQMLENKGYALPLKCRKNAHTTAAMCKRCYCTKCKPCCS